MNADQGKILHVLGSIIILSTLLMLAPEVQSAKVIQQGASNIVWKHLSTATDDVSIPGRSKQQTASLILDIDYDGINDFVIASRRGPGPSMVWYRRMATGWDKYIIDSNLLNIEAGGAYHDIDQDGDLDIVMGGDDRSNQVWWWENPAPTFDPDTEWVRRTLKNSGPQKHHDQMFGDFDGDGLVELVFWNQRARRLFLAEIPDNPYHAGEWPRTAIYEWDGGLQHEGLAQADIDGDGLVDILGGGRWFKYEGGTSYKEQVIDDEQRFTRVATGQLVQGGRPEVVFVVGDGNGPLKWYEWSENSWIGHDLLGFDVKHGHSLDIVDINSDGFLDIFSSEMRLNGRNDGAKSRIFFGDGNGSFTQIDVTEGIGNHESRIGDLDGDGDLDILGKPYNWEAPRIDIWLNESTYRTNPSHLPSTPNQRWCRRIVDSDRPWRAVFVTSADLDGDDDKDIITGGWWYKNPGSAGEGWVRHEIGTPLNNLATVGDFDHDGDLDILGTTGKGSNPSATFMWAQNDGYGSFTILDNIPKMDGDFLQGVAMGKFETNGALAIALSWHKAYRGIQLLSVPAEPAVGSWSSQKVSDFSQDEQLSVGDIDGDGDLDLLTGTAWLRNNWPKWTQFAISNNEQSPDRNRLADVNGDGRLDVVVGYEAINTLGMLAWYEQPLDGTSLWIEHKIATVVGPMSVDVADMDLDGDVDVVVGEHNTAKPDEAGLYVYTNTDGTGNSWSEHLVYIGDEHHDGAHIVDIDGDNDFDIVSIGWSHNQVVLYENSTLPCDLVELVTEILDVEESPLPLPTMVNAEANRTMPNALIVADLLSRDKSSVALPADFTCATDGLQALYTFQKGSGSTVYDVSGKGVALDLTIEGDGTKWLPDGGLSVEKPTHVASHGPATKIINASKATGALSVEVWVKPSNVKQDGPARIVTISSSPNLRNFTLGQGKFGNHPKDVFDIRVRTTSVDSNNNGEPSITTTSTTATTELTHFVYTRNANKSTNLYLDGVEIQQGTTAGDFTNWDDSYPLTLGNEFNGERPWLGQFHKVAIYNCGLDSMDVNTIFRKGVSSLGHD